MLAEAESLVGKTAQVAAKPSNARFQLPIWTGPDTRERAPVQPLQPGHHFRFHEVRVSGDSSRICGRIDGVGWVNLACRYNAAWQERPVWYSAVARYGRTSVGEGTIVTYASRRDRCPSLYQAMLAAYCYEEILFLKR